MSSLSPEFRLIHDYFTDRQSRPRELVVPIGDDAAVMDWAGDRQLVVCTDTLNQGVHFPESAAPADIGWKALAVNLSDLAAMGATPCYFTLSLSLPTADAGWLGAFSEGLFAAAEAFNIVLIGGDTTRGPLSVSVTAIGSVEPGRAVQRSGAAVGDRILVSGSLGDAAAGLQLVLDGKPVSDEPQHSLVQRLHRPVPRLTWGRRLAGVAGAMIDISDGLCADLGHILAQSGVGAMVDVRTLPLSPALLQSTDAKRARAYALGGGDDYELCLTVAPSRLAELHSLCEADAVTLTDIGVIEAEAGLRLQDENGIHKPDDNTGWDHFA